MNMIDRKVQYIFNLSVSCIEILVYFWHCTEVMVAIPANPHPE